MNIRKTTFRVLIAVIMAMAFCPIGFAVEIRSVRTLDSLKSQRSNFSSSENINFACEIYSAEAVSKINFTFVVRDPSGRQVFKHTGNSVPGSIGIGGSEVGNVPLSSLYTTFGAFTLEVTATPATGSPVSGTTTFSVYSPIITLSYPANGIIDLIDQPLIFRWIASGASRYRIYVDDDQSFYNTLFTDYTQDTTYTYPMNPADSRQRLASGTKYYWKVEGLDGSGNKVAQSPTPFSFTLKQSGGSSSAKDVAITAITLGQEAVPPQVNINVETKNLGGSAENNITVTLYIGGMVFGTQKIDLINIGETKVLTFNVTMPDLAPDTPLFVSASHNYYDDNVRNNILTQSLTLKDSYFKTEFARIIGKITDASTGKAVPGATVTFKGPKSGEVTAKENGQYKIEDLTEGSYTLKALHPKYMTEEKVIKIEKGKAYPNINFELLGESDNAGYSLSEIWELIKPQISKSILEGLDGYVIFEIKGAGEGELNDIAEQLKNKKAKVTEAQVD
jgi:hypothetical protein